MIVVYYSFYVLFRCFCGFFVFSYGFKCIFLYFKGFIDFFFYCFFYEAAFVLDFSSFAQLLEFSIKFFWYVDMYSFSFSHIYIEEVVFFIGLCWIRHKGVFKGSRLFFI